MPCEQLSAEQQRPTWSTDNFYKINVQYPVCKAAVLRPEDGNTLVEESKNRSSQWTELHAVFLAMMEELNDRSFSGSLLTGVL